MATIGEVGADSKDKEDSNEKTKLPLKLYFGVFFDGTSNNMIQSEIAKNIKQKNKSKIKNQDKNRDYKFYNSINKQYKEDSDEWELVVSEDIANEFVDGANQLQAIENGSIQKTIEKGYSNIAILHSIYKGIEKEQESNSKIKIYNIYVEGPGTEHDSDSKIAGPKGSLFGTGKTGVTRLVQKAMDMIHLRMYELFGMGYDISNSEIHFHVFGFSRGATAARLFSYCVAEENRKGCLGVPEKYNKDNKMVFLNDFVEHGLKWENINVDMLGIFDTVSSCGGLSIDSYINNTTDYGLYSPTFNRVKNVMHLCALDEFRSHFAITDIGSAAETKGPEIFLPGCHSDIGGGYINREEDYSVSVGRTIISPKPFSPLSSSYQPYLIPLKTVTSEASENISLEDYLVNGGWGGIAMRSNELRDIPPEKLLIVRHSESGYSNTPLKLMKDYSMQKASGCFKEIPPFFGELAVVKQLLGNIDVSPGRRAIYPGNSFNSESYKQLRRYLHFSAKDSIGFDMSFDQNIVRRYRYRGEENDATRQFVSSCNV